MGDGEGLEFSGLNLVCADIEATIGFYRLLGVAISDTAIWRTDTGPHHVERIRVGDSASLELDSPQLARAYNQGQVDGPASSVVIGFRVPSRDAVDELYVRLTHAGHIGRQPPHDAFWGARYAIVADPDGRDVGFMSPSDAGHRSAPPQI